MHIFKLNIVVVGSAILASCGGPILGPGTLEDKLAVASDYANRNGTDQMRRQIGPQFGNASVSSRIDNGETLVLIISDLPSGNTSWDPNVIRGPLRQDLCARAVYRELFAEGGQVRLEVTSNTGFALPPVQVADC